MPAKAKKEEKAHKLPELGQENYDVWEMHVKHCFYAADWLGMYEASQVPPDADADAKKDDEANAVDRKKAWGTVTRSLNDEMLKNVDHVALGEVEQLLVAIRSYYYRNTVGTKNALKKKMQHCALEDHTSFETYSTWLKNTFKRLAGLGYDVSDEDKAYYLLEGLPSDYDTIKTTLTLPRATPLTWDEHIFMLREFITSNPGIVGGKEPKPDGSFHGFDRYDNDEKSQETCRDHAKGHCKRGNKCRFRHVEQPRRCAHCKKNGHTEAFCWTKKREQERPNDTAHRAQEQQQQDLNPPAEQPQDDWVCAQFEETLSDEVLTLSQSGQTHANTILVDGGASSHVSQNASDCFDIVDCNIKIKVGGGVLICRKTGKRRIYIESGPVVLTEVRIIPNFGVDVLAENRLLALGCKILKHYLMMQVSKPNGKELFNIRRQRPADLFFLPVSSIPLDEKVGHDSLPKSPKTTGAFKQNHTEIFQAASHSKYLDQSESNHVESNHVARTFSIGTDELHISHARCGHRNFREVAQMEGHKCPDKPVFCRACVEAFSTRYPIGGNSSSGESLDNAPRPGYLFHGDTIPFRHPSHRGNKYALLLVDDCSRKKFLSFMHLLSETVQTFKNFVARMESEFGKEKVVAQMRTDSASYFAKSTVLQTFCQQKGIYQIYSPPYTQALNGVAERNVRSILDMTRALLLHAGAPVKYYQLAMEQCVKILNVISFRKPNDEPNMPMLSPLERWEGRSLPRQRSSLRVWGCAAYPLEHSANPDTFDPKAVLHVNLGNAHPHGWWLGTLPGFKVLHRTHVTFNESHLPLKEANAVGIRRSDYTLLDGPDPVESTSVPIRPQRNWTPSAACLENIPDVDAAPTESAAAIYSFIEEIMAAATLPPGTVKDPTSHRDAVSRPEPEATEWRKSEIEEFESHVHNGTFGPATKLPPGKRAVTSSNVYKTKRCGRKKTRIVIRGYLLAPGIDYNETFAPVARLKTIRIMMSLVSKYDLELLPFDVKTAFLSADMDTEVYVHLPPAFNNDPALQPDAKPSTTVHRLLKGVPGIPQGSRLFNNKVHTVLTSLGFRRCPDDYCLYKHDKENIALALWTDDGYIAHKNQPVIGTIREELQRHFDIKFLEGDHLDMLGVIVSRDRANRTLSLSQQHAVEALLDKAGMKDCKPVDTPVATNFVFTKQDCPQTELERADMAKEAQWYRMVLCGTIYIVNWTRADTCFGLSKLSKFMQNPGPNHVSALKRLLRYLKGTVEYKLVYSFASPPVRTGVYGYFDSAHADDVDTCRSTMAYLFFYEGCLISWHSKLHTYVTTSTNHSEYVASAKTAREACWHTKVFTFLGLPSAVRPIDLFNDSSGAIAMNHNPVHHEANKHVAIADHFAREQVELGIITISHMRTDDLPADVLTKPLPKAKFLKLVQTFMN